MAQSRTPPRNATGDGRSAKIGLQLVELLSSLSSWTDQLFQKAFKPLLSGCLALNHLNSLPACSLSSKICFPTMTGAAPNGGKGLHGLKTAEGQPFPRTGPLPAHLSSAGMSKLVDLPEDLLDSDELKLPSFTPQWLAKAGPSFQVRTRGHVC